MGGIAEGNTKSKIDLGASPGCRSQEYYNLAEIYRDGNEKQTGM